MEDAEETTRYFTAPDSDVVLWRQENSFVTVAKGTTAVMLSDSTECAALSQAVDSVMTHSPRWSTYYSQKTFVRSYYAIGPYYVAYIAEEPTETGAEGTVVTTGYNPSSFFWIFDRVTRAYINQRVLLIGI